MDYFTNKNKPVMVSLSTIYSQVSGSRGVNSQNTFGLLRPISTQTEQDIGGVALSGFTGPNTIVNLPVQAPLIIQSKWFDELLNETVTSDYIITFPVGQYSYSQMLSILNSTLPAFSDSPYPGTVYGLGGTYVIQDPPTNLPVEKSPINSKFIFEQFSDILEQTFSGTVAEHIYQSFTIKFTRESYPLWVMLGLTTIQNPLEQFENVSDFVIPIFVQSRTFDGTDTTIVYDVGSPIYAPYTFNFSGTKNLYVYTNGQIPSSFRSPFDNNNESNLICRIPVQVPYGFVIDFEPQNLAWAQVKNLNLSNIQLTVYDDFNHRVDFQGANFQCDIMVRFAKDEDALLNVSGTAGVPNSLLKTTPSDLMHPSAMSYNNGGGRDLLGSSQIKLGRRKLEQV